MTDNEASTLPEALKAAASAAAVGAAVGAARAYSARRHEPDAEPEQPRADDERVEEPEVVDEQPAAEQERPEPRDVGPEDAQEETEPVAVGEIDTLVTQARRLLRDLRGADAESVSSVAHGHGGWIVGLEVVEVKRVPESTDVLATYEVELDGAGGLVRFERVRRYRRSEADRGGRT